MKVVRFSPGAGKFLWTGVRVAFLAMLLTLFSASVHSQPTAQLPALDPESYPLPGDMGQVQFYLITVDVGNQVWDNFGHTALRLVDESSGVDLVFNWGLFDASGGVLKFSYDFFKGIMSYQLGTAPLEFELSQYRQQRRTVWQDRINLSNEQKEILYRRLLWNIEAENRVYSYHYFLDNCTTRVRDYLNEALSGSLQSAASESAGITYRSLVFDHYRSVGLIGFSLDVAINSDVDSDISGWEYMFLPLSLRQRLLEYPSEVLVDGRRQMLLSDSEIMEQFEAPEPQINGYWLAMGLLLVPTVVLFGLLRNQSNSMGRIANAVELKQPAISYRLLGLLGFIVSLFAGIYGLLMLGSWMFSDHETLHHNLNLLLFWPTDLLGLFVVPAWLFKARPRLLSVASGKILNYYLIAHLLAVLIYLFIKLLGFSDQSVSNVLIFILPGYLLFLLLSMLVGFKVRPSVNA